MAKPCECWFHRYHCVHIYKGRIYDHSQGTWDETLRWAQPEEIETFPSRLYEHGMTAEQLRAKAAALKGVQRV